MKLIFSQTLPILPHRLILWLLQQVCKIIQAAPLSVVCSACTIKCSMEVSGEQVWMLQRNDNIFMLQLNQTLLVVWFDSKLSKVN